PVEIAYTGNASASLTPYRKVQFTYESRPDNSTDSKASKFTVRLSHIKTLWDDSDGDSDIDDVILDYQLGYESFTASTHPTWLSRLSTVTLCDGGGTPTCLPATTFTW